MALPIGTIVTSLLKGYAKNKVKNTVTRNISKKITYKAGKQKIINRKGKPYIVYSQVNRIDAYSLQKLDRDIKAAEKALRMLLSRSILGFAMNTQGIFAEVNSRVKFSGYINSFSKMQESYRMNFFDRIIFDVSQQNNGYINRDILFKDSYLNDIFGDTRTYKKVKEILNEYIDKKSGIFEHLRFFNSDNKKYKVTDAYFKALDRSGMLDKDIQNFTERLRNVEPNKFCVDVLEAAVTHDGLSIKNILSKNPDLKERVLQHTFDKLTNMGFLKYISDSDIYHITEKGIAEIFKRRDLDPLETAIYEHIKEESGFNSEKFIEKIVCNEKLLNALSKYNSFDVFEPRKEFSFGRYDANFLFRQFKNNKLDSEELKKQLINKYKNKNEALKQHTIMTSRLNKLAKHGYVTHDKYENVYQITDLGYQAKSEFGTQSNFSSYDINCIVRYTGKNPKTLGKIMLGEYEPDYAKEQTKYLISRLEKNVDRGYLYKEGDVYRPTKKGNDERAKYFAKIIDKAAIKLSFLKNAKLVDDKYIATDLFRKTTKWKIPDNIESFIKDNSVNGIINTEDKIKAFVKKYSNDTDEDYRQYENWMIILKKLEIQKYLRKTDEGYKIIKNENNLASKTKVEENLFNESTDEGKKRVLSQTGEYTFKNRSADKKNTKLTITRFDKSIFNAAINGVINLSERKEYFEKRFSDRYEEAQRQYRILTGRCNKLEAAGYLEKTDEGFRILKQFDFINEKKKSSKTVKYKDPLQKYRLTAFDFKNIAAVADENIWSPEIFILRYPEGENKLNSIKKRLKTLEEMGLAENIGNGRYRIDDILFERSRLRKERGISRLAHEQKEIVKGLKYFLNFTEDQIIEHIYDGKEILGRADINQLVSKGYLGLESRIVRNDGEYFKIYYLQDEGKKAASHLTGTKTKSIYNSKLHYRPEELYHDLLI